MTSFSSLTDSSKEQGREYAIESDSFDGDAAFHFFALNELGKPQAVHGDPAGDLSTDLAMHFSGSEEPDNKQIGDAGGAVGFDFEVGQQIEIQNARGHHDESFEDDLAGVARQSSLIFRMNLVLGVVAEMTESKLRFLKIVSKTSCCPMKC